MNDPQQVLRTLLNVEEPWKVTDTRLDTGRRRHDIWIALEVSRGWFGLGRARAAPSAPPVSWRHVNFGDWEVHVHVAAPGNADLSQQPWAGEEDLPFSRALTRQVFEHLREGCSLQSIGTLLRLPVAELWRFRYALDSGRWSAAGAPAAVEAGAGDGQGAEGHGDPDVPAPGDPVWVALLDGSLPLEVRALGLRLLLSRLRAQFAVIGDDEVRGLKLQECHRYFLRNKHQLAHELAQLKGEVRAVQ